MKDGGALADVYQARARTIAAQDNGPTDLALIRPRLCV